MTILYTSKASASNGRDGHAETDNKSISVDLTKPGAGGTNPEELFACGYAACFGGAMQFVAKQKNLDVGTVTINSAVDLNKDDSGFFISATLSVDLPMLDQAQAEDLMQATHQFCPYSKATRGNINVTLVANGKTLAKAA
jgi:Ohr subfamily peroxiredoxin